jgi:hypothetical protein
MYWYTPKISNEENTTFKDNDIYISLERFGAPYNRNYLYSLRISFKEESQPIANIEVQIQIEKTGENLELELIRPSLSFSRVNDIDYNELKVQQFNELPVEVRNTQVGRNNGAFVFKFVHKNARDAKGERKARKHVILKYDITMENGERRQNEILLKENKNCFFAVH